MIFHILNIFREMYSRWGYLGLNRLFISEAISLKVTSGHEGGIQESFFYTFKKQFRQQWKRDFRSSHLYLLFSIRGFASGDKLKIWAKKKITETRSCWIQHKVLSRAQYPAFVSTSIMLDLESWAHFGCSVHFHSGAECIIQPNKNWLLGHFKC